MTTTRTPPAPSDDAPLERLFEGAARRPAPPDDDVREVRAALHATWREVVQARHVRRRRIVALAASVVVALAAVVVWQPPFLSGPPPAHAAEVERVQGEVRGPDGERLSAGDALAAGARLETGAAGAVAVRTLSGASVRIGADTRVVFAESGVVTLDAGRLYVDSGRDAGPPATDALVVRTRFGEVTHIGTQYMTEVGVDELKVSVREGLVRILDDTLSLIVERDERVRVDGHGQVQRARHAGYGAAWAWAEGLAPVPDFDGRPVAAFVRWLGRETGRRVRYATPAAQAVADETRLRGTIDPAPGAALDILNATTDLRARFDDGEIVVDMAPDAERP